MVHTPGFDIIFVIDIIVDFLRLRDFSFVSLNELVDDRRSTENFLVDVSEPDKDHVDVKVLINTAVFVYITGAVDKTRQRVAGDEV